MRKLFIIGACIFSIVACTNAGGEEKKETSATATTEAAASENPSYDTARGAGKFTNVEVGATLDQAKATAGKGIFDVKCSSCHKLSGEKLVGPGWAGVTSRHKTEWIMNFVTNTDEMLNKDPKAQAMLELCLVRMPNQSLTDEDARNIYEFMRKNDGVK